MASLPHVALPGNDKGILGFRFTWRRVALGAVLLLVAIAAAAGAAWHEITRPLAVAGGAAEVRLAAGSTARSIAHQLRGAGVPVDADAFVVAAMLTHSTRSLQAGRYRVESGSSILDLLRKFADGDVERAWLTIVEGTTFAQLRAAIAGSADLRHDTASWPEDRLLHALGTDAAHGEGLFAPDTYAFEPGASDLDLYRQAFGAQRERLDHAWQARAPDLPYKDAYEALIMASLIEKETGRPEDRRLVAAVFVNRQRLGMPLQTDPAVIYGLGDGYEGRLHRRDLQQDTPYNTYTRSGLPPTPIALPGRASIEAALNPEPSKALYFVSRGDGSSEFSASLAEHNRAVDRYQRAPQRQVGP